MNNIDPVRLMLRDSPNCLQLSEIASIYRARLYGTSNGILSDAYFIYEEYLENYLDKGLE